ncbi:MAG: SEC-C metal-binding domain-containing protein, partial [Gemmatimonadota bacterium]|nr:SEC-C metal-binding domain-containing protein [Gemmatimonadota bacterium]
AFEPEGIRPATLPEAARAAAAAAAAAFHEKLVSLGEFGPRLLSLVMLNVLDEKWKDHLYDLDQLRAAIGYRSWGQKDPLVEYKQEAFAMFEDLMRDMQHTVAERFLKVQLVFEEAPPVAPVPTPAPVGMGGTGTTAAGAPAVAESIDPFAPMAEPGAMPRVVGAGRGVSSLAGAAAPAAGAGAFDSVSRNDPCPCGSGKKFKKCHGAG